MLLRDSICTVVIYIGKCLLRVSLIVPALTFADKKYVGCVVSLWSKYIASFS